MCLVEQVEAVERGLPEFLKRNRPVQIRVGGSDGLRQVEQGIAASTLRAIVHSVAFSVATLATAVAFLPGLSFVFGRTLRPALARVANEN